MGKELYDNYNTAREIFDAAGSQIKEWCFNGTAEMLRQTFVTQPSIYVVTMAAYRVFTEEAEKEGLNKELELTGIAGFSLGEYSALTAAGTIDGIGKGIDIVKKRGAFMQEAGTDSKGDPKGGMVAAFGAREKILDIIEQNTGSSEFQFSHTDSGGRGKYGAGRILRRSIKKQDQNKKIKRKYGFSF